MEQDTLASILKHYREEEGLSVAQISEALKISPKHIVALESGNYAALPDHLYTKHYVEAYAKYLGLNVSKISALYNQERGIVGSPAKPTHQTPTTPVIRITPPLIKGLLIACAVLVLGLYLAFQIQNIFTPPDLTVAEPADNIITDQTFVTIQGSTEREAIVHINEKEIALDRDGNFSATLDLQEGLNIIKISARKKNSKEHTVYRQILVER